jgi:ATP-dependent Lon protease
VRELLGRARFPPDVKRRTSGPGVATGLAWTPVGGDVLFVEDTAMTGELTLHGLVLPIGGLKEKALAAQRAGVKRVLAPRRNEPDLEDFPEHLLEGMDFLWVGEIGEVFEAALDGYARK